MKNLFQESIGRNDEAFGWKLWLFLNDKNPTNYSCGECVIQCVVVADETDLF